MTAPADKLTDLDLMLFADGELDAARARQVAAAIERDPALRAKLEGLGQVRESVKTYLELETDHAEADLPEFADMWATIEKRIQANGAAAAPVAAPVVARPARPETTAAPAAPGGVWAAIRGWFEGHRGHVMTGLVSAGAVAGLMLWLRPVERIVETRVGTAPIGPTRVANGAGGATPCGPAATPGVVVPAAPPEVESFEVYEGSGMVFTLPGEDADDTAATVIWISKDQDTVEGPI